MQKPYDDEECSCYDTYLCPVCETEIEAIGLKENEFLPAAAPSAAPAAAPGVEE